MVLNGFKVNGETVGDASGLWAGRAGDMNHDGIADLLLGFGGHASSTGRSYVVFGSSTLGAGGSLAFQV